MFGAMVLGFAVGMLILYAHEIFREPATKRHEKYTPPLRFEENAVGPWAYFADEIKPPQRQHF